MPRDAYSWIDASDGDHAAPVVRFPPVYNLAADLVHRHVAQGRGERIAVIDDEGRHSWAELSDGVDRAAAAFVALGVAPEQIEQAAHLDLRLGGRRDRFAPKVLDEQALPVDE